MPKECSVKICIELPSYVATSGALGSRPRRAYPAVAYSYHRCSVRIGLRIFAPLVAICEGRVHMIFSWSSKGTHTAPPVNDGIRVHPHTSFPVISYPGSFRTQVTSYKFGHFIPYSFLALLDVAFLRGISPASVSPSVSLFVCKNSEVHFWKAFNHKETRAGVYKTLRPQHLLVPKYGRICNVVIPQNILDFAQTFNR